MHNSMDNALLIFVRHFVRFYVWLGTACTTISAAWSAHVTKVAVYKSYREIIMSMNILVGTLKRSLTKKFILRLTTVNIHYNHKTT